MVDCMCLVGCPGGSSFYVIFYQLSIFLCIVEENVLVLKNILA